MNSVLPSRFGVRAGAPARPASAASAAGQAAAQLAWRMAWRLAGWARSWRLQALAIALAWAGLVAIGWHNDGMWFQGDAPRHAMTGLFTADLLQELPADPLGFALAYYARYPVIVPLVYPPGFHALEGLAYLVLPASPWVAKGLVQAFALLLAAYTQAWARRWLAPAAGWAGAALLCLPGVLLYSNAVLLNVPATALGLAALYHLRRWMDGGPRLQLMGFAALSGAAVMLYYPAGLVLLVALVWVTVGGRWRGTLAVGALLLLVALAIVGLGSALPAHLSRNLPSPAHWFKAAPWQFYGQALLQMAGAPVLLLAGLGLLAASRVAALRREALLLALALGVLLLVLVTVPATDARYALLALPLLALALWLGPLALAAHWRQPRSLLLAAGLALVALVALPALWATRVPAIGGLDALAAYLVRQGPGDALLYAGRYEANLGFYLRAADPGFNQRLVLARRLLAVSTRGQGFDRKDELLAETPEQVLAQIRARCGCRWVALEARAEHELTPVERQLRQVLQGPAFEHVASFALQSPSSPRLDLYRARFLVTPAPAEPLRFPYFADRHFPAVAPVQRGR